VDGCTYESTGEIDACRSCVRTVQPLGFGKAEEPVAGHDDWIGL
jgi:hypothetical protein